MNVYFFKDMPDLYYDTEKNEIRCAVRFGDGYTKISIGDFLRFMHNKYTNKSRFIGTFIEPIRKLLPPDYELRSDLRVLSYLLDTLEDHYDDFQPFSYAEAFRILNETFQSYVFGSVRVSEMIKELGHTRIKTAGRPVRHKQFSKEGEFLGYVEYDVVFETHRVSGAKLGLLRDVYAVKCWCTTTANEHWLWIQDEYKDDPLEAIARTFYVHENLVPFIKELKRQGDVLLVELTQDIEPRGEMVSLSKDQYFNLLTAQS